MFEATIQFPVTRNEIKFWLEMGGYSNITPTTNPVGNRMQKSAGTHWTDNCERFFITEPDGMDRVETIGRLQTIAINIWREYYTEQLKEG